MRYFFIVSLLFLYGVSLSQPIKAEKEFLEQLNSILKNSKQQHWSYNGTMTIDSAFAISKDGLLSVTVHYTNDSSIKRVRMVAPIQTIEEVAYDLYLILKYRDNEVTVFETEPGGNTLIQVNKTRFFHIGAPEPEDIIHQEKLQKALDDLLKYYHK